MKKTFERIIEEKAPDFGSIPFWSLNDELKPDEIRRQVRIMYEKKMKGFFMHARMGLTTEYLSDDWFDCIAAAADEADKYGMEAWLYDENGWPSGYAGMKLLDDPDNFAKYLTFEIKDEADEKAMRCYKQQDGKFVCVYKNACDSYVDTMDVNITKKFIESTHEQYKKRFGPQFGKRIPGFFTDEPQYYRWNTPWSDTIPEEFRKAYGYDVFSGLDALYVNRPGADTFRYDYWKLCHNLFLNNFQKPVYEWAEANGCRITGHTIEESFLAGQMWCTGGVMPFYKYEHIPGIDKLCRGVPNDLATKQVSSVAAQYGKKRILSEMYAACGWDVPIAELKRIAEWQYCGGVNLMCQHMQPYSIRGQRKTDYPCYYSFHNPWSEYLADFDEYFNRLGAALGEGEEEANVLVIHPIHSCWMKYIRDVDMASITELEEGINRLLDRLQAHQISWHFGDETLMAECADVVGNKIRVGNCSYDTVVIPLCYTLDDYTAGLLKRFLASGGKVCAFDKLPECIDGRKADMEWLQPNMTMEEIYKEAPIKVVTDKNGEATDVRFRYMKRDDGYTYYLLNVGEEINVNIDFKTNERIKRYNPETGKTSFVCEGGKLTKTFKAGESAVFYTEKEERPVNTLVLDKAVVYYGNETNGKKEPIEKIRDLSLRKRYSGDMTLKFDFNVRELPDTDISLAVEPMEYKSITVNGKEVKFGSDWYLDRTFKVADVTNAVKVGKNEIVLSFNYWQDPYVFDVLYLGQMESRRNCLTFNTEIENIYLFGDFAVETDKTKFRDGKNGSIVYSGDFTIAKAPDVFTSDICNDLVKNGYPFFGGKIHTEDSFIMFKNEGVKRYANLELKGNFAVAEVYLNGKYVKKLLFGKECDISEFILPGENKLDIYICSSGRNLFGPYHNAEEEPLIVAPGTFTCENGWTEEGCGAYINEYCFMPFGFEPVIHIGD